MENIFFVAGHHAVGKTHLVNQVVSQCPNIANIDTGPTIRQTHIESQTSLSFSEWEQLEILKKGEHFADNLFRNKLIEKFARDTAHNTILVTGYRSLEGIWYLTHTLGYNKVQIIYIDSNYPLMKENYEKREQHLISDKDFMKKLAEEKQRGLRNIKEYVKSNPQSCKLLYNMDNNNLADEMLEFINSRIVVKNWEKE
jgi:hypothetical protein